MASAGQTRVDAELEELVERYAEAPEMLPYHERLHGRAARNPIDVGWRGWWDIVVRVVRRIGVDHLALITAGVTFYMFLALVPAVLAVVTVYGTVSNSASLADYVALLHGYLPDQAITWFSEEFDRLSRQQAANGLSATLLVAIALSFWAMNNAVLALFGAMNIAYREAEKRSTIGLYLRCFVFTLGALVVGIAVLGAIVIMPLLLPYVVDGGAAYGGRRFTVPAFFVVVTCCATAIYRVGPSRRGAKWRWILTGALAAAGGWIAAATLLSWYLSNIANYAFLYGSLGTIAALLFWLYISVYIFLLGAWLNAETEHQTLVDTTVGPAKPLGERGAAVADWIGRQAGWRR